MFPNNNNYLEKERVFIESSLHEINLCKFVANSGHILSGVMQLDHPVESQSLVENKTMDRKGIHADVGRLASFNLQSLVLTLTPQQSLIPASQGPVRVTYVLLN